MTNKPYSNREIDSKHREILTVLERIEKQTIKTNGRVTWLEKRNYIFMGGMSVTLIVVVPMLGWALWTLTNIDDVIDKELAKKDLDIYLNK